MAPAMAPLDAQEQHEQRSGARTWFRAAAALSLSLLLALVALASWHVFASRTSAPAVGRISSLDPSPIGILLQRLDQIGGTDSRQELALHLSTGHLYRDQGWYTEAAGHYAHARELSAQTGDDGQLLEVVQELGATHLLQGHLKEAQTALEEALSHIQKPDVTLTSKDIASQKSGALHMLGNVRREMGHLNEALEFYSEALQVGASRPDSGDQLMRLLGDIGYAHLSHGRYDDASEYFQEALDARAPEHMKVHGQGITSEEVALANVHGMIGLARYLRGDVKGGLELYQKALRIQAQALRPAHPELINTRLLIARAQRDLGNTSRVLIEMEPVEVMLHGSHQEELQLSRVMLVKSDTLRELGRFQEAESAILEVFKLQSKCFGNETTPELASALNTYGSILQDAGKPERAEMQYFRALATNLETVGHWHPETAAVHNSLGTLMQDLRRMADALEHFQSCLEIQKKTVGEANPDVASTYNNIATILYQQGDRKQAAQILQQALEVLDKAKVPEGSPDRALYAENLKLANVEAPALCLNVHGCEGLQEASSVTLLH